MNHLASLNLLTEAQLWKAGVDNPLRFLGHKPSRISALAGPRVEFRGNKFVVKP